VFAQLEKAVSAVKACKDALDAAAQVVTEASAAYEEARKAAEAIKKQFDTEVGSALSRAR
jgi:exonuclease VII small subunit